MNRPFTIYQFFHWYTNEDGQWWNYCASRAPDLASKGITHVYLPPAYKSAQGIHEPGYAVYDLYDLGEFDQKGTIRTRYGTRDEYIRCINSFHEHGIAVIADVVLNHRIGADETERFEAVIVNHENRNECIGEPHEIEGHTLFYFPGRNNMYSSFRWDHTAFSGVDAMIDGRREIFCIQNGYTEKWETVPDTQNGNYDFLTGADVEFRNPHVREELLRWGKWYIETTGVDGLRMDAVKHISYEFIRIWINEMRNCFSNPPLIISEYWNSNVEDLLRYFYYVEDNTQLFDVPLHFNFHHASLAGSDYDLREIFNNTLVQRRPEMAITFVENHDTQPLQSLESPVEQWFKPLAYACILLRQEGIPVIFNPCEEGAIYKQEKDGTEIEIHIEKVCLLDTLLYARTRYAFGRQSDYLDHPDIIGWVREGNPETPGSGCVVIMSNAGEGEKEMLATPNQQYRDLTGNVNEQVCTNENGAALFKVKAGTVSVWVVNE